MSARIALALLLALFAGRLLHTAASQSFTIDEPGYVGTGLQLWRTGDYDFARVLQFHPPLAFQLASVPLLFMDLGDAASQPRVGPALLREGGPPLDRLRLASRLPFVLATVWGALLGFLWASEAASPGAGLLAAFLFSFSPSFLAYGPLAHSDALVAVLTLQALYTLWRWERHPSAWRLVACGVSLGLALVAKLSAVLLVPAFALELLRVASRGGPAFPAAALPARLGRAAGVLAALGALSLGVLWLTYGGSFALATDPTGRLPDLPLPGWLRALLWVGDANAQPRPYFFLGSLHRGGDALFMPVAFLSKEALGWLALLGSALAVLATRRTARLAGFLAIPCAIYVFILIFWLDVPLGYRYALPLVGLLCVLAGAELWPPRAGWPRHAVTAACALLALESLSVHPHYLAFFNRAVGGPAHGHALLLDSNLDWGQDVTTLAHELAQRGNPPTWLALFAAEDPARQGIRGQPLIGCAPVSGWLAISANVRFGLYAAHNYMAPPTPGCYAWLDAYEPVAVPGWSIYLYELPPSAGAAPSPPFSPLFSPR